MTDDLTVPVLNRLSKTIGDLEIRLAILQEQLLTAQAEVARLTPKTDDSPQA